MVALAGAEAVRGERVEAGPPPDSSCISTMKVLPVASNG
jgi:hypothetical protein